MVTKLCIIASIIMGVCARGHRKDVLFMKKRWIAAIVLRALLISCFGAVSFAGTTYRQEDVEREIQECEHDDHERPGILVDVAVLREDGPVDEFGETAVDGYDILLEMFLVECQTEPFGYVCQPSDVQVRDLVEGVPVTVRLMEEFRHLR